MFRKIVLLTLLLVGVQFASGECHQASRMYHQPTQRLDEALQQLVHQTGCPVRVTLGSAVARRVPALRGRYTPLQALHRLIRHTGFTVGREPGGFVLFR